MAPAVRLVSGLDHGQARVRSPLPNGQNSTCLVNCLAPRLTGLCARSVTPDEAFGFTIHPSPRYMVENSIRHFSKMGGREPRIDKWKMRCCHYSPDTAVEHVS